MRFIQYDPSLVDVDKVIVGGFEHYARNHFARGKRVLECRPDAEETQYTSQLRAAAGGDPGRPRPGKLPPDVNHIAGFRAEVMQYL